jgi:hypothetical protein
MEEHTKSSEWSMAVHGLTETEPESKRAMVQRQRWPYSERWAAGAAKWAAGATKWAPWTAVWAAEAGT